MNNALKRRVFDTVVWSASLLFAFGLLLDSALADDQAIAGIGASCNTERGDVGEHAVRVPR